MLEVQDETAIFYSSELEYLQYDERRSEYDTTSRQPLLQIMVHLLSNTSRTPVTFINSHYYQPTLQQYQITDNTITAHIYMYIQLASCSNQQPEGH